MRISDWSSDVCSSDLVLGQREIAGLSAFLETDAHLDEEGARGERPEGFGGSAIGGDERGRRGRELAMRAAVIEDRPGRAAHEIGSAWCRERVCQYVEI